MCILRDIKYKKIIYIKSQSADPSPPLGTVLGNIGVNTVNFCTSFNNYTKNLPNYFLLKVNINIFDNRSFSFTTNLPSLGFILNLIKFENVVKIKVNDRIHDKSFTFVNLYQVLKLVKLKFGSITYNNVSIIKGTLKSMNLLISKNIKK